METKQVKNIMSIILEVWNANNMDELLLSKRRLSSFNIWVSYIMAYGYSSKDILEFAKSHGIKHDPQDCDPDDEYDTYGALVLTPDNIKDLRGKYETLS